MWCTECWIRVRVVNKVYSNEVKVVFPSEAKGPKIEAQRADSGVGFLGDGAVSLFRTKRGSRGVPMGVRCGAPAAERFFCILKCPTAYGPITIAIRARFEYDSTTIRLRFGYNTLRDAYDSSSIQHPTRSYVLSSNNEHVNSFAML